MSRIEILSVLGIIRRKSFNIGGGKNIVTEAKLIWINPLTWVYVALCAIYILLYGAITGTTPFK